jgi:phosphatidate cytidylyltransferase
MNIVVVNADMAIRSPVVDLNQFQTVNFRQRLMSALILVAIALGTVAYGGLVFGLFVILTGLLGLREWLRLIDPEMPQHIAALAFLILLVTLGAGVWVTPAVGLMIGSLLGVALFVIAAEDNEETAGWIVAGIPYMAGSGLAILYLRSVPGSGFGLICYLFAAVWGTDIGAYLVGRIVGGPKLAPDISPNKTWAGFGGGILLAGILSGCVAVGFGVAMPWLAVGLSLLLAAVSQAGDLFKSYFKRRAGVKESGGLIPGHGGVLDRIDGLVFAAIFLVSFHIALGDQLKWW